ncbi:glucosaminidase domain-containing protein [Anaerofustis sp. HA2171]|uniref:glucosaminidase domain-containing protein n=1 Tax=Anaerofustis butyriciformans TaxID=3108533 RepID=UPI002E37ABDE|nr:glucosaminidase domain-containing protein [Anaerofustis sp. HA2171]
MKKRIAILLIILLMIPSLNVEAQDLYNIEIPDFVKNEAQNEQYYKTDKIPKEYLNSNAKRTKEISNSFYVAYAYPAKNKQSDEYNSIVKFEKLKTFDTFTNAKNYMDNTYNEYININTSEYIKKAKGLVILNEDEEVIDMKTGRAYISAPSAMLVLDNAYGSSNPYITNNQEVFYLGAENNGNYTSSKCKIGISGITNYTSSDNLTFVPEILFEDLYVSGSSNTKKYNMGYYSVNSNSDLCHYVSVLSDAVNSQRYENSEKSMLQSFVVDKAPSFMKSGTKYFSMDGVNFYTSKYLTSSSKAGTHYPYFTYLSYRTKTSYTAAEINKRINTYPTNSKLKNMGETLINVQNKYGINALMELGFANLESGYGTSSYAQTKNNLFGIAAYDENPDNAYSFSSPAKCIEEHAYRHLSRAYFDANSDFRYYGTSPGNKKIGVNVKYASDPYHGEKIGGNVYLQDKNMGSKDYEKYTIAITNKTTNVYQNADSSSKTYYKMANKNSSTPTGMPVVIIGEKGDYYKIQNDMGVVNSSVHYENLYDYTSSVGYIKKSDVDIVRKGKTSITQDNTTTPKISISSIKIYPALSYGFTPGYANNLRVDISAYSNIKNAKVELQVYNSKKQLVAKKSLTKSKTGTTTEKIYWDGKATKDNKAGYKTGSYVNRSSKGTNYTIRVILSVSGKSTKTKDYTIKVYSKATKLSTGITKTSIKRKYSTTLYMTPNRPGTSMVRIYDSKNRLVFKQVFYYKKANTKNSVTFKGYGNYDKNNKKLLPKGKYKVKFTHGDYTYTYPKTITLK